MDVVLDADGEPTECQWDIVKLEWDITLNFASSPIKLILESDYDAIR